MGIVVGNLETTRGKRANIRLICLCTKILSSRQDIRDVTVNKRLKPCLKQVCRNWDPTLTQHDDSKNELYNFGDKLVNFRFAFCIGIFRNAVKFLKSRRKNKGRKICVSEQFESSQQPSGWQKLNGKFFVEFVQNDHKVFVSGEPQKFKFCFKLTLDASPLRKALHFSHRILLVFIVVYK